MCNAQKIELIRRESGGLVSMNLANWELFTGSKQSEAERKAKRAVVVRNDKLQRLARGLCSRCIQPRAISQTGRLLALCDVHRKKNNNRSGKRPASVKR